MTHSVQKSFMPLVVIALLLFGPKRSIGGLPGDSMDVQSLISIIVIGWGLLEFASRRRDLQELFPRPFGMSLLGLLTLLIWTLIVAFLNGSIDLFYPLRTGRATLTFIACAVVTWRWSNLGFSADKLLKVLFWYLALQAVAIIGEILSPEVRDFIYDYWSGYEVPGPNWLRVPGLIVGLAYTSVIQLIGLIIGILCIPKTRGLERILTVIAMSLIGISLIFTGRTGLVLGFLIVPLLLLRGKLRGVIVGVAAIALMVVIGDAVFSALREDESAIIWDWAFEWLPMGTDDEMSATPSMSALNEMWFAPDTEFGWLVGSSRSYHQKNSSDPGLVASDIGYVAFLHGIGLPGLVLSSLIYLVFLVFAWQKRRSSPIQSWCMMAAVIIFSVGNAKEVMFLTRWGWELSVLLLGALVLKERENAQAARQSILPAAPPGPSPSPQPIGGMPATDPAVMREVRPG